MLQTQVTQDGGHPEGHPRWRPPCGSPKMAAATWSRSCCSRWWTVHAINQKRRRQLHSWSPPDDAHAFTTCRATDAGRVCITLRFSSAAAAQATAGCIIRVPGTAHTPAAGTIAEAAPQSQPAQK